MRVLMGAGASGGHIYPLLSLAAKLRTKAPGSEIVFAGAASGLERRMARAAGLPYLPLGAGLRLQLPGGRVLSALCNAALRSPACVRWMRQWRPDVVITSGGYGSLTVSVAALCAGVPLVLLELNTVPGRVNRLLGRLATAVALQFEECRVFFPERVGIVTGMPVRPQFATASREESRQSLRLGDQDLMLLVFGGSQAARQINRVTFRSVSELLSRHPRLWIHHLCGGRDMPEAARVRRGLDAGLQRRYRPRAYVEPIWRLMAAADLVLCRAGGSSIAELTRLGVPAVFVPLAPSVDAARHQYWNGASLARRGAAVLIPHGDFSPTSMIAEVSRLMESRARLQAMRRASLDCGHPDADDNLVALLSRCARGAPDSPMCRRTPTRQREDEAP